MKSEILLTGRTTLGPSRPSIKNQWLLAPLIAMILLLLAACTPASTPTPESTISAQELLDQARLAMDAVRSYGISVDTGVSNYDDGKLVTVLRGQWAAPHDYRLRFEIHGPNDASIKEIISVGNRTLVIQSNGFQIELEPDQRQHLLPVVPFNFSIIPELVQVDLQGESRINGADVYHITAVRPADEDSESPVSVAAYGIYFGESGESRAFETDYDLYIGKEDMLLKRLRTTMEMSFPMPDAGATRTTIYNYFDYNAAFDIKLPPADPCNRTKDGRGRLDCDGLSQRVYWLDEQLAIPGAPNLMLNRARIDNRGRGSKDDVLTFVYSAEDTSVLKSDVSINQWSPAVWKEFLTELPDPDPEVLPPGGLVNWWQHPCVEEEVYQQANGVEVHLFKAHLPSLIYIYPMSKEQVSECLKEPVGAVGAHVYFEETVVEFSVQNSVSPAAPQASFPGSTPRVETRQYPELVIHGRNPYNDVETVRLIAASLRPYEKP